MIQKRVFISPFTFFIIAALICGAVLLSFPMWARGSDSSSDSSNGGPTQETGPGRGKPTEQPAPINAIHWGSTWFNEYTLEWNETTPPSGPGPGDGDGGRDGGRDGGGTWWGSGGSVSLSCSGTTPQATIAWATVPMSPSNWTFCASEWNYCSFSDTMQVRYGAEGRYVYRVFTNGTWCTNSVFGDPIYGVVKACHYRAFSYYILTVSGVGNFNSGTTASYTVSSGLANNTAYDWSVEAYNADGQSSASLGYTNQPHGSFTTPNCAPPPNQPPSATNLSVSQPDYCLVGWASAIFSWNFSDPGDTQSAYQVQVDNNSNFSSPEVDSGKVISSSNSFATQAGQISFNNTYYWRLMVWDSKDAASSWISGPAFATPGHAYPSIDFSWTPLNPTVDESTQFTDQSTVYGGSSKSSWSWTFQNGSPPSSIIQNPLIKFLSTGAKAVTLRVTDSDGFACTGQKTVNTLLKLPDWKEIPPF